MATSLDALEALLQFRKAVLKRSPSPLNSSVHPPMPVPNPLDPTQPHIIEGEGPSATAPSNTLGYIDSASIASPPNANAAAVPVLTTVPNPLAARVGGNSSVRLLPPSSEKKVAAHGFSVGPAAPTPTPIYIKSGTGFIAHVRTDKIRDALNSKPQRGKKRQNLNELERQELTRTRNREHARSTRMKKKARLQELLDTEKRYMQLMSQEDLCRRRRELIVQFVECVGIQSQPKTMLCSHSSLLEDVAIQALKRPQFSIIGDVALTSEDSGMVRVSARGSDLESGEPKTLTGVIHADFVPRATEISAVALFWSPTTRRVTSGGMVPSISVSSFDS